MTPPAKKAQGRVSTLRDALSNKAEDKPDDSVDDETRNDENTTETNSPDDENDRDNENDRDDEELDAPDKKEPNPADFVAKPEKGTDNQASSDENDEFVNPDGVTHSGRVNRMDKTPADMSAETAQETANRYGLTDEIPQDVHDNPNSRYTRDNNDFQIPGGTHLHPDIARDNYMRSVGGRPSESGQVTVSTTQLVFAEPAALDDKGINNDVPENLAD